ncbi:MAG: hypothetical protein EXQ85_01955 [Alphaproteobacteria bacterium]|nr:hypothetical protein [Alphaproteobacteria bacterium]
MFGERSIYTPQIVVGGVAHEVGSRRDAVDALITKVSAQMGEGPKLVRRGRVTPWGFR